MHDYKVGDHVEHIEIANRPMVILAVDVVNSRLIARCEWRDLNGDMQNTLFPTDELRLT